MTEDTQTGGSAMQIDIDLVRQLATMLDDTGLTEIEVEDGGRRIRVVRNGAVVAPIHYAAAPAAAAVRGRGACRAGGQRQRGALADGRHRLSVRRAGREGVRRAGSEGRRRRHAC